MFKKVKENGVCCWGRGGVRGGPAGGGGEKKEAADSNVVKVGVFFTVDR